MSATHKEPIVYLALVAIRIEFLLAGNLRTLELSTFITARPASLMKANC